jgi:hypothetical protein
LTYLLVASPTTLSDVVSQLFEQYLPRRRSLSNYGVLDEGLHEHCTTFHFGQSMRGLLQFNEGASELNHKIAYEQHYVSRKSREWASISHLEHA